MFAEEVIKQVKIKRDKKGSIIFKGEDNSYYGHCGFNGYCYGFFEYYRVTLLNIHADCIAE